MSTKDNNHKATYKFNYNSKPMVTSKNVQLPNDDNAPEALYVFGDDQNTDILRRIAASYGEWIIQYATWDSTDENLTSRSGFLIRFYVYNNLASLANCYYFYEMLRKYFDEKDRLITVWVADAIDSDGNRIPGKIDDMPSNKYPIFVWKVDEPEKKYELVLDSQIVSEDVNKE